MRSACASFSTVHLLTMAIIQSKLAAWIWPHNQIWHWQLELTIRTENWNWKLKLTLATDNRHLQLALTIGTGNSCNFTRLNRQICTTWLDLLVHVTRNRSHIQNRLIRLCKIISVAFFQCNLNITLFFTIILKFFKECCANLIERNLDYLLLFIVYVTFACTDFSQTITYQTLVH